jgi:hypothetical protein
VVSDRELEDRPYQPLRATWRTVSANSQQLHGIVSLRISRPRFPWPPLAETVIEAVDRILVGGRSAA